MSAFAKRCLPLALVAVASTWISFTVTTLGDYPADAGPAVDALTHGHYSVFLAARPMMGPFSILLRAPFAALPGGGELDAYRWGALPCVLAAGLLGLYLAGLARRRGSGTLAGAALVGVCLFNPLTYLALGYGHPEEILTAALAVAAVATASEGHTRRTALLLGLAIASKQWAVIAILPALMALPSRRFRVGLGAAGVVLALILPAFLADPHNFVEAQQSVTSTAPFVGAWSAWYPIAGSSTGELIHGPAGVTVEPYHGGSALIGHYAHPLIVLLAFALPLALAVRRRRFGLSGADAMGLLALLALLRCALDPINILYYHLPLLLALAGWDALDPRGLPVRALAGAAVATLLSQWGVHLFDPQALNALYLAVATATVIAIALALLRRPEPRSRRAPVVATAAPGPAGAG